MPRNTFLKPACTISSHSSASSARFTEASVKKPIAGWVRARQPTSSRSSSLLRLRLPMKLSSTMNTMSRQPRSRRASSSRTTCAGSLVRGTRPFITTMSQNSQLNGQPRENCTGMAT